jgi:hypothetical protein
MSARKRRGNRIKRNVSRSKGGVGWQVVVSEKRRPDVCVVKDLLFMLPAASKNHIYTASLLTYHVY